VSWWSKIHRRLRLRAMGCAGFLMETLEPADYKRGRQWRQIEGDQTLRLYMHNLEVTQPEPVIVDVGGHVGQWASDMYARTAGIVYVFEPVHEFADLMRKRFHLNPKVQIHEVGLGASTRMETILVRGAGSSVFHRYYAEPCGRYTNDREEKVTIRNAVEMFEQLNIGFIDIMKVNIEGGEYELLPALIDSLWIRRIQNLQIQFHDFVPGAQEKAEEIRRRLAETHSLTFQYPWIWENWRLSK
jgi:FkbM family methyltransferase